MHVYNDLCVCVCAFFRARASPPEYESLCAVDVSVFVVATCATTGFQLSPRLPIDYVCDDHTFSCYSKISLSLSPALFFFVSLRAHRHVTVNLAVALSRLKRASSADSGVDNSTFQGTNLQVGLMDGDIYGPSVPTLMKLVGLRAETSDS